MNKPQQIIQSGLTNILLNPQHLEKALKQTKRFEEIRIVYFGTPDHSALLLDKLINSFETSLAFIGTDQQPKFKFVIQAVITSKDILSGKTKVITPTHVALTAQKYNIPVIKADKLDAEFIKNHLSLLDSDIFLVASFGKLIPQSLLAIPRLGSLNVHPSLLPKYRGASPIQNAILKGDKISGITIIKMNQMLDQGPIVYQEKFSLSENDTFDSLSKKMFLKAGDILIRILSDFVSGTLKIIPQDDSLATFCQEIKKEDGYFDIENPPAPEQLDRMIRAYYPWPTAWTKWKEKIVKLLPNRHPTPGVGSMGSRKDSLDSSVHWDDNILIQMEGKNVTDLKSFLNGYPDFPLKEF